MWKNKAYKTNKNPLHSVPCRVLEKKEEQVETCYSMLTMPTYDKVFFWKTSIHKFDSVSQTNVQTHTRNGRGLQHFAFLLCKIL